MLVISQSCKLFKLKIRSRNAEYWSGDDDDDDDDGDDINDDDDDDYADDDDNNDGVYVDDDDDDDDDLCNWQLLATDLWPLLRVLTTTYNKQLTAS